MRLRKSDINLLLLVAGIVIAALAWVAVASPLQEKTQTLEAENASLKSQKELYEAVNANLPTYEAEIAQMQEDIVEISNSYPVNISREDEIMFLSNMEDAYPKDIAISNIEMAAFMEVYTDQGGSAGEGATLVHMFKQPTNYDFRATYKGLKDMTTYLIANANKKGIEEITLSLEQETGNLHGTFAINQFYMTGLDKEYQPIKIPSVRKGVPDVFHTVKNAGGVTAVSSNPEVVAEETEEASEE